MRGRAQYAESPSAANGCNNVAAMAESEQRKLDAQHLADRRFHVAFTPHGSVWCCSFWPRDPDASAPWTRKPSVAAGSTHPRERAQTSILTLGPLRSASQNMHGIEKVFCLLRFRPARRMLTATNKES